MFVVLACTTVSNVPPCRAINGGSPTDITFLPMGLALGAQQLVRVSRVARRARHGHYRRQASEWWFHVTSSNSVGGAGAVALSHDARRWRSQP